MRRITLLLQLTMTKFPNKFVVTVKLNSFTIKLEEGESPQTKSRFPLAIICLGVILSCYCQNHMVDHLPCIKSRYTVRLCTVLWLEWEVS